tara:strand:+ start:2829 stop:3215 length:387 start_codon:yes stop_codon:yes gene_type:complete
MIMKLEILEGTYVVVKLPFDYVLDKKIFDFQFFNITKTNSELSLVIRDDEDFNFKEFLFEDDWNIFKFAYNLDFSMVGVLESVIKPLSENDISVFVFSTYETDYVMFKSSNKNKIITILELLDYEFIN